MRLHVRLHGSVESPNPPCPSRPPQSFDEVSIADLCGQFQSGFTSHCVPRLRFPKDPKYVVRASIESRFSYYSGTSASRFRLLGSSCQWYTRFPRCREISLLKDLKIRIPDERRSFILQVGVNVRHVIMGLWASSPPQSLYPQPLQPSTSFPFPSQNPTRRREVERLNASWRRDCRFAW